MSLYELGIEIDETWRYLQSILNDTGAERVRIERPSECIRMIEVRDDSIEFDVYCKVRFIFDKHSSKYVNQIKLEDMYNVMYQL